MNDVKEKLSQYLKKIPPKGLIIIGAIGVILIALSSLLPETEKTDKAADCSVSHEEYNEMLELKISEIVRSITGEKNPTVAVTLQTGMQYLYAGDEKNRTEQATQSADGKLSEDNAEESEKGFVIVKDSSGDENAVIVTEYMPEIRGVAVVCEGGNNESLREEIINAVTSALGISSRKIYVTSKNY